MEFAPQRYDTMLYRRCGRSGLKLPAISLGLWQGTGSYVEDELSKQIVFTAFNHGITHFDLANNYGTPPGASEELFGRILKEMPRHELLISTKAGYPMWPGPYGDGGSRKYLIESCEQSLKRMNIDHVDIFYSHRLDLDTPMEETLGALDTLVQQGKALYAGISSYPDPFFTQALAISRQKSLAPITIHQPYYHMLARQAEREVLPTAGREGVGVIAFCPLAQGLLTDRYLNGIPEGGRTAHAHGGWLRSTITPEAIAKVRQLNDLAKQRGQTLPQMALAWLLKDQRVTSVLIGASKPQQIDDCVGSLAKLAFSPEELATIETIIGP